MKKRLYLKKKMGHHIEKDFLKDDAPQAKLLIWPKYDDLDYEKFKQHDDAKDEDATKQWSLLVIQIIEAFIQRYDDVVVASYMKKYKYGIRWTPLGIKKEAFWVNEKYFRDWSGEKHDLIINENFIRIVSHEIIDDVKFVFFDKNKTPVAVLKFYCEEAKFRIVLVKYGSEFIELLEEVAKDNQYSLIRS